MSLDGAFLSLIREELIQKDLIGSRVEKIHQPSKEELILTLKAKSGTKRLLFCANGTSPRVHLTAFSPENPPTPPMFCMLMRKHLGTGRLSNIRQDGFERILFFEFECTNEIGEPVSNTLVIEIMGRHSNILLLTKKDGKLKVVDSVKRITDDISSVRRVLPGIEYTAPPRQKRFSLLNFSADALIEKLHTCGDKKLDKVLPALFEGISPIFAREAAFYVFKSVDGTVSQLDAEKAQRLIFFLERSSKILKNGGKPVLLLDEAKKPFDFCFIPIEQYGLSRIVVPKESANALLDEFYIRKSNTDRIRQKSNALFKTILSLTERITRKTNFQRQELEQCSDKDQYRRYGDLVSANIYRMEKGMNLFVCEDYNTGETVEIPLDTRLTPAQNAQRYYSEYKKRENAQAMLTKLIAQGEKELLYLDSIFDALTRAEDDAAVSEIKEELIQAGYLRPQQHPAKKTERKTKMEFLRFKTSDGFEVLIGKNNIQNDVLTLKTASKEDLWLHTKDIPGSHVILKTDGKEPTTTAIREAAMLAAYCSKARDSSQVPVDYVKVKYIKKPSGAKPGMVTFTNNKTLYVTPDPTLYNQLMQ